MTRWVCRALGRKHPSQGTNATNCSCIYEAGRANLFTPLLILLLLPAPQLSDTACEVARVSRAHAAYSNQLGDLIVARLAQDQQVIVTLLHEDAVILGELTLFQPRLQVNEHRIFILVANGNIKPFCLGWHCEGLKLGLSLGGSGSGGGSAASSGQFELTLQARLRCIWCDRADWIELCPETKGCRRSCSARHLCRCIRAHKIRGYPCPSAVVQVLRVTPHRLRLDRNLGRDPLEREHCEGLLDLNANVLDPEEADREELLCEDHPEAQLALQGQGQQQQPEQEKAGRVFGVAERDRCREDVLASPQVIHQASDVVLHQQPLLVAHTQAAHLRPQPVQHEVRRVHARWAVDDLSDLSVGKASSVALGALRRPRRRAELRLQVMRPRVPEVAHQGGGEGRNPACEVAGVLLPRCPEVCLLRKVSADVEDGAPLGPRGDEAVVRGVDAEGDQETQGKRADGEREDRERKCWIPLRHQVLAVEQATGGNQVQEE
mmetsp:Transcript_31575/g.83038  ORF Transcript_31575/g.83038 Transcript_31575/m.83038 type:complete len:491 (-) Transcript_31575:626-2098(-)